MATLLAAALLRPLPGPTPMRCQYDGDSGSCKTLFSRSTVTVALSRVLWGAEVVNRRP